ncbi:MAG: TIGR01212 family radical SAM protein [Eubacterium sp.]|nr:TIGR01212 family radical SAM protein [Eubacterium sp.]
MKYDSLNRYLQDAFGEKLYKIAINAGFTCPNRDGTLGTRGCIFCSGSGSGDFAEASSLSVTEQIEKGKARVEKKFRGSRYIAYFQAFTNTYAPVSRLRELFTEAIHHPDIAVLSVATRPDCLPDEVVALLAELNRVKPVWVELGLQTIHEKTAEYIRRGYSLPVYDDAVMRLKTAGLSVITHVILGLPGETPEMMKATVRHVVQISETYDRKEAVDRGGTDRGYRRVKCQKTNPDNSGKTEVQRRSIYTPDGIKLQLLHVLEGTDLARAYRNGEFEVMTLDQYTKLVCECLALLPEGFVVHRITGDGPKRLLIAPQWSADKKRVLNSLNAAIRAYEP